MDGRSEVKALAIVQSQHATPTFEVLGGEVSRNLKEVVLHRLLTRLQQPERPAAADSTSHNLTVPRALEEAGLRYAATATQR